MRIFLTVPFFPFRHSHPLLPDLGLGYLASSLRNAGHAITVNDWNNRCNLNGLAALLRSAKPDIVGIKFFTFNARSSRQTLDFIRSILGENTVIVMGGPHPSSEDSTWLHHDFPEAQGRFIGEAEESFRLFSEQLAAASSPRDLLGHCTIKGFEPLGFPRPHPTEGTIVEKLDDLPPPAWDLIKPEAYPAFRIDGQKRVLAPFMATRGCPLGCEFCCTEIISGKKIRHHSPEYLAEQIRFVRKHHSVSALSFLDTNFMTDKDWLLSMLEHLAPMGDKLVWNCVWGLNPAKIDGNMLASMRQAGCNAIIMGIETGNDQVRETSGKKDNVEQIREQVALIQKAGINVHGFFMLGFPDETLKQMRETLHLAFSLPLEALSISLVYPLPGTGYYKWLKQRYNLTRIDWTRFTIYSSDYPMSHLSSKKLSLVRRYAQVRNMLSPRRLQEEIRRGILSGQVIRSKLKTMFSR